ncbi:pyridoxal phosphate-dependent aminotransferase [Ulvibacter antarcticus]|uniref:Histidinol-phosphate aminotransferase n=1 Tax=Ulvibacter antarcticus TaxID=442714 RepID=A0A3L9YF93_9FLAO|nr:histidinol-phosphate transaminase [Ulvibacter antarcticus]RMA58020.1 histidinol-phosphate aminotransferase [Ulvibacter antarcticus]
MKNKGYDRRRFLQLGGLAAVASTISPALYGAGLFNKSDASTLFTEEEKIRLFSNENPYGPGEKVMDAINSQIKRVNHYASFHQYDTNHLKEAIATKNGINTDQVILGHGSFDILRMLTRSFGNTENSLIMPALTFNVVGRFADKVFDHKQIEIPLDSEMNIDLKATAKAVTNETKLVFICNPNNPTGRILKASELEDFCKEVASEECVVAIDEAYIDMVAPSERPDTVKLLLQKHNVLILRTFSKAYGMAGLRVGYAMGLPETVEKIYGEHYTFNGLINTLGVVAAITALEDDTHVNAFRSKNLEVRSYTENALRSMGIEFLPSSTNFLLINIKEIEKYRNKLNDAGISPVGGSGKTYPNWSRISIGDQKTMEKYISVVQTMDWLVK